jgi:uncharacterized SAM-binding protein YcdF (DUF218 family)
MFFILSKTIDFILLPYTWIIICAACAVFLKHKLKKRIAGITLLVLLLVLGNTFFVNYLISSWEIPPQEIATLPAQSTAIILTGITQLNKKPYDRLYFQKGADRVTQAIMLYRKGKIKNFIITGGSGKLLGGGRAEASELKKFMIDCLIPDSIITIEDRANSSTTLKPPYILITSSFHMRRSLACFQKEGIDCIPFPVDYYSFDDIDNPIDYVIPEVKNISTFSLMIREMNGYLIYYLSGYL